MRKNINVCGRGLTRCTVIISQHTQIMNQYVVHMRLIMLYVSYISIKILIKFKIIFKDNIAFSRNSTLSGYMKTTQRTVKGDAKYDVFI